MHAYDNLTPAALDLIDRRLHSEIGATNARDDALALLGELRRTRLTLGLLRGEYANLLAAARATVAAHRDGEADALGYLRDELDAHGQLPSAEQHPAQLLALACPDAPAPYRLTAKANRVLDSRPRPRTRLRGGAA